MSRRRSVTSLNEVRPLFLFTRLLQVLLTIRSLSSTVQTPPFLRLTKHTSRGEDDAKFSYVVVRRGQRPATSSTSSFANLMAELDLSQEQEQGSAPDQKQTGEVEWPRMIAPPLKRSGHVILEVCAASGDSPISTNNRYSPL